MTPNNALSGKVAPHRNTNQLHWWIFGIGALMAAGSIGIMTTQPHGLQVHIKSEHNGWTGTNAPVLLSDISGQTYGRVLDRSKEIMLDETQQKDVALAGWRGFSSNHCLTVTTQDGKSYAFRILGNKSDNKNSKTNPADQLYLATAPCEGSTNEVVEMIIENKTRKPEEHTQRIERSL